MGEHEDQEVSTSQEEEKDSDETDCVVKEEDLENQLGDLEDVDAWIVKTLHEIQPDAEITLGSVKILSTFLDNITTKVLDEAKRISEGSPEEQDRELTLSKPPLTSLDIHKALKRLLPGEPGDPLRPYLPAITKKAWHLDKQSLKGVKKQKVGAAAAAALSLPRDCREDVLGPA